MLDPKLLDSASEAAIAARVSRYIEQSTGLLVDGDMFKRLMGIIEKRPQHFAGLRVISNPLVPPGHVVFVDDAGQVLNVVNFNEST